MTADAGVSLGDKGGQTFACLLEVRDLVADCLCVIAGSIVVSMSSPISIGNWDRVDPVRRPRAIVFVRADVNQSCRVTMIG